MLLLLQMVGLYLPVHEVVGRRLRPTWAIPPAAGIKRSIEEADESLRHSGVVLVATSSFTHTMKVSDALQRLQVNIRSGS